MTEQPTEIEKLQKKYPELTIKLAQKLYHKKYVAKLQMYHHWLLRERDLGIWIGRNYTKEDEPDVRLMAPRFDPVNSRNIEFLYFETVEHIISFVKEFEKKIKTVWLPLNQAHIDESTNDEKVIIRQKLFFNKYRYRVIFNYMSYRREIRSDIIDWYNDLWATDEEVLFRSINMNPSMYFKSEDDLIMVKLAWSDNIEKIERIILKRELTK